MLFILSISNMAGLAGSGQSLPIQKIFHDLSMSECVPLGAIMGMISTLCRFIL